MTTPSETRLYPPSSAQLTLNLLQSNQEAAIVLGLKHTGVFLVASDAMAVRDAAWAAFRPLIHSNVSCVGATLRHTNEASGRVDELGPPPNPLGSNASAAGVASGCTLIKWGTGTGGRSGKGRTYLPGLSTGAINTDGRTYSTTHQTATGTAIAAYLGASAFSSAVKPAVLSFTKGEAYTITSGAISPIVGLQRRRMR